MYANRLFGLQLAGTAALLAVGVAGCAENSDRSDFITRATGNALAFNKAVQIVSPWPASARRWRHGTDGESLRLAMDRYHGKKPSGSASGAEPKIAVDASKPATAEAPAP